MGPRARIAVTLGALTLLLSAPTAGAAAAAGPSAAAAAPLTHPPPPARRPHCRPHRPQRAATPARPPRPAPPPGFTRPPAPSKPPPEEALSAPVPRRDEFDQRGLLRNVWVEEQYFGDQRVEPI